VTIAIICLQAPNDMALQELSNILTEASVQHKLWIEQPENIPTCLATKPCPKQDIQKYFKKFKLFKGTGE
jgi:Peptidyl-tRNA hydrolase PTH2